jgi:endonuclease/exonuclease/phosphatase family metal-dependent hydrolase
MTVKIMSYNTQHCLDYIKQRIDFDLIANTIKNCGADIIGLQEIRGEGPREDYVDQIKILSEKTGFYYYFAEAIKVEGANPYGNAILSRYPILNAETIAIPDPKVKKYKDGYETRCILKVKIDVFGGLNVLVSHFGLNKDEQKNAVTTVLENLPDEKCVLMGDFNMKPRNRILKPVKEKLFDTAEKFTRKKLSYPSDKPKIKIDYIFTSKDLCVKSADIPEIISSDHRPHVATLDLK